MARATAHVRSLRKFFHFVNQFARPAARYVLCLNIEFHKVMKKSLTRLRTRILQTGGNVIQNDERQKREQGTSKKKALSPSDVHVKPKCSFWKLHIMLLRRSYFDFEKYILFYTGNIANENPW